MIDVDKNAVVSERRTADDGRFALFTSTDVLPYWGQRFWGVVLDTGADGHGILVRYGTASGAPSGWTLRQLLCVAQARLALEHARSPEGGALAVLEALGRAVRQMPSGEALGNGVEFASGARPSPYTWTVALCGEAVLPLCPDPESRGEGVTPEQLIIVVDEALRDWCERAPYLKRLWACRNAVRDALAAEIRRVRVARGEADAT